MHEKANKSLHAISSTPQDRIPVLDKWFIKNSEIVDRQLKKNRWSLKLKLTQTGKTITVPQSHYVWLSNNPTFRFIPRGYSIHHLDKDETNDDPVNLILMKNTFHVSYHIRGKIKTSLPIPDGTLVSTVEPRIFKRKDTKAERWKVSWCEEGRTTSITSYLGRRLKTKEDAEWAKAQIWQPPEDSTRCPRCGGRGFVG